MSDESDTPESRKDNAPHIDNSHVNERVKREFFNGKTIAIIMSAVCGVFILSFFILLNSLGWFHPEYLFVEYHSIDYFSDDYNGTHFQSLKRNETYYLQGVVTEERYCDTYGGSWAPAHCYIIDNNDLEVIHHGMFYQKDVGDMLQWGVEIDTPYGIDGYENNNSIELLFSSDPSTAVIPTISPLVIVFVMALVSISYRRVQSNYYY